MRQSLKEYIYYLKITKNLSENTILAYKNDLEEYIDFLEKNYEVKRPNSFRGVYLKNYLKHLERFKLSKSSTRRKISSIKSFNKYLISKNRLDISQIEEVSSPKVEKRIPVVLSVEEVNKLIETSKGLKYNEKRNYAMLNLLYGSGLRISELVGLNISDIHINVSLIKVYGKGSKERIVPMNKETVSALKDYMLNFRAIQNIKDKEALFLNKNGERITRIAVFKIIKELAIKANIDKDISPHTLRHSFATHMLENGADIMAVKDLLGHEDIQTTEIYTHVSNKKIFDIYDEIFPRNEE